MNTPADGERNVKISCHNTDCDNGLHCYRPKKSPRAWAKPTGECKECGDRSVDWDRVKRRDLADMAALQSELRREWIRHYFWDKSLDQASKQLLAATSRSEMIERVRKELAKGVGPPRPFKDGTRVPVDNAKLEGHPIFYAQHATACCCKKCAYYWWGLPRDQQYTDQQVDFLTEMCMAYLDSRGLLPAGNP